MPEKLLSIGIIFKNEIRCIERCLQSLQPLREMLSCEIVVADTGATDGSRVVAERYADLVIDFPWINDFSAARNAVMDRCSGRWYMSIDCDEWLGGNLDELVTFIREDKTYDYAGVIIRNYQTADLEKGGDYTDFLANRLLRMSTGLRFKDPIHEHWPSKADGTQNILMLQKVFFHHDGYLYQDPAKTKEKLERNMNLLRKKLEKDPEDLLTLLQCIESGELSPEYLDYIHRAVQGVEEHRQQWKLLGPPILRYSVVAAYKRKLPELDENIERAERMFPEAMFTRIDVGFVAFGRCWAREEYKECIRRGTQYLKDLADFDAGNYNRVETLCSTLMLSSIGWKTQVQIFLAAAYLYEKQPEKCMKILSSVQGWHMSLKHVDDVIRTCAHLHSRTRLDTAELLRQLWDQLCRPEPLEERAEQRKKEFIRMSAETFRTDYQDDEAQRDDFHRHAYTLFLPLAGQCVLGDAAEILETEDPERLEELLSKQEDLRALPAAAVYHALERGVMFPLPGKPMMLETIDMVAGALSQDKERLYALTLRTAERVDAGDFRQLAWARALALASIRACDWKDTEHVERNHALAWTFAEMERLFLPACYSSRALEEEGMFVLPPLHRFGWYCAQAYEALDGGNQAEYVRLLRLALESCPDVKPMVQFLLDRLEEERHHKAIAAAPPELLALAEQVRGVLGRFLPDDPMVKELKESPAYQKVAWILEEPAQVPLGLGSIPQ